VPAVTAPKLVYLLVVVCSGLAGVSDYDLPVRVDVAYFGSSFGFGHSVRHRNTYRSIFDLPGTLDLSAGRVLPVALRSLALGILWLALGSGVQVDRLAMNHASTGQLDETSSAMLYRRL
jgi:hypothetical protein